MRLPSYIVLHKVKYWQIKVSLPSHSYFYLKELHLRFQDKEWSLIHSFWSFYQNIVESQDNEWEFHPYQILLISFCRFWAIWLFRIDTQTIHHFLEDLECRQFLVMMKWRVACVAILNLKSFQYEFCIQKLYWLNCMSFQEKNSQESYLIFICFQQYLYIAFKRISQNIQKAPSSTFWYQMPFLNICSIIS